MSRSLLICALVLALASRQFARGADADPGALPGIVDFAKSPDRQKLDGMLPLYWSQKEGKLFMEVSHLDQEMLYVTVLVSGVGLNEVELDRGRIGGQQIVKFHRIGRKVLLIQPNYSYRSSSSVPEERNAVQESFPESVLAGFDIVAETGGDVIVEATKFFTAAAPSIAMEMKDQKASLDASRSTILYPEGLHAFPRNVDVDVLLTFTSTDGIGMLGRVSPNYSAVTVRQRHSFIALPPPGYEPREADPRAGFFETRYQDFAAPLGEPTARHLILRHRLKKANPDAAVSDPVKPIVYYLDRAAPEPLRQALLEGGNWWNQAFAAAGYRNAFRVELLPVGADPLDVRYNVIEWVNRTAHGWSTGNVIVDPRTGEIIRGHVLLDALRARYDYLIAEGLLSPYEADGKIPPQLQEMALNRLKQLAAHEIGHTLGLMHDFVGSSQGLASVMDYPPPLVAIRADGTLDISHAYADGIGEWDKAAIAYGYQDFPSGTDQQRALDQILSKAASNGLWSLSDGDAAGAHPDVARWDAGHDPASELTHILDVRRKGLDRFGETSIRMRAPFAALEDVLMPLYLLHQYQTSATAQSLGGTRYRFTLRGLDKSPPEPVPAAEQAKALEALLRTLDAGELVLPERILKMLPPRPPAYMGSGELFPRQTGRTFDVISPSQVAATYTLSYLFDGQRAARIVQQHDSDPHLPGLEGVIDAVVKKVFDREPANAVEAEIRRGMRQLVVNQLIGLAGDTYPMPQVTAVASFKLHQLGERAGKAMQNASESQEELAGWFKIGGDIRRFEEGRESKLPKALMINSRGYPMGSEGK